MLIETRASCPITVDSAFVNVSVQQVRRGVRSFGTAGATIECTGATQTVWFTVPSSDGPNFSTGRAYAEGLATGCHDLGSGFECSNATDETDIRIRR